MSENNWPAILRSRGGRFAVTVLCQSVRARVRGGHGQPCHSRVLWKAGPATASGVQGSEEGLGKGRGKRLDGAEGKIKRT